ncbi:MAG TPA: hypothetical protein VN040_17770 [Pseudosphingobacterium sp.]|nr:hypothetical protein [Pseudosphingobacterium sp.]
MENKYINNAETFDRFRQTQLKLYPDYVDYVDGWGEQWETYKDKGYELCFVYYYDGSFYFSEAIAPEGNRVFILFYFPEDRHFDHYDAAEKACFDCFIAEGGEFEESLPEIFLTMNSLNELTYTERGRLLVALFPEEKTALLNAILGACQYVIDHEATERSRWQHPTLNFDQWIRLAADITKIIARFGFTLRNNGTIFSDQLFYDQYPLFIIPCIREYVKGQQVDPMFKVAVNLLFNESIC